MQLSVQVKKIGLCLNRETNVLQVWAEDGDNDDWHCVQTLDESTKYSLNPLCLFFSFFIFWSDLEVGPITIDL